MIIAFESQLLDEESTPVTVQVDYDPTQKDDFAPPYDKKVKVISVKTKDGKEYEQFDFDCTRFEEEACEFIETERMG